MRRIHVINRRTKRIAAIAVGLSLIAAACGDDDDDGGEATTAPTEAPATTTAETTAPEETSAPGTTEAVAATTAAPTEATSAPAEQAAMSVTCTLSDTAVWNDGSPMSWEDFECTWLASINTPESITTTGYNQITSVTAGATDKE